MAMTDAMARILDLAQAGLDDPSLSADELAGRAYLSRFHFDRLVSASAGEPPGAMRRRILLERAAYRLTTRPDRTVLDIACGTGLVTLFCALNPEICAFSVPWPWPAAAAMAPRSLKSPRKKIRPPAAIRASR